MIPSMSRRADCWDNAVVESFFATLEWELYQEGPFATRAATHRALIEYFDTCYNRERMHSTLHYQSPMQFEHDLLRENSKHSPTMWPRSTIPAG